jgi:hypothetical protein
MFKNLLIVVVMFFYSAVASAAGALAIDENQGDQYGFAYDYASVAEASQRALAECGGNCSVVQVFESGCAAYAADQTSGSTVYGWATSSDGGDAQSQALQYCSSYGGTQCIVRSWGCNSN